MREEGGRDRHRERAERGMAGEGRNLVVTASKLMLVFSLQHFRLELMHAEKVRPSHTPLE